VVRLVNALEKVQRLRARLITRAWKKVALPILEAEACLISTKERLDRKVSAHVAKLTSLPKSKSRSIERAAETKRIQATYRRPAMDPSAIDRPQTSSGYQRERLGNQGHGHDSRSRYSGPIHRYVSREAAGRHSSRKEDWDFHLGRQARLDRMGIYV
jgi:hypothetical protein